MAPEDFTGARVLAVPALLLGLGGSLAKCGGRSVLPLSFPETVTSLPFSAPLLRHTTPQVLHLPGACSSNPPALRLSLHALHPLSLPPVHTPSIIRFIDLSSAAIGFPILCPYVFVPLKKSFY